VEGLSHLSLCKGGLEGDLRRFLFQDAEAWSRDFAREWANGACKKRTIDEESKRGDTLPFLSALTKSAWWPYSALAVSAPIARAYFLPEKRISFSDFLPSLLTVVTAELRSGV